MTPWSDLSREMEHYPLDTDTADRLLTGSIASADAPPGYEAVAAFLTAVANGCSPESPAREAETAAVLGAVVRSSHFVPTKRSRRSFVPRLKFAAAFAIAALVATTGLALAGSLPGAAQDAASAMLAKVGVSVSGPNSNAGDHPNVRATSSEAPTPSTETGKGGEISDFATSTDLTGVEKGAAISGLASDGQSQAGQHGQATAEHGAANTTAGTAGETTAATESSGHSTSGSANATTGQSHRP